MKYNNIRAFEKHLEGAFPKHLAPVYMLLSKDDFQRKSAYDTLLKYLLVEQSDSLALKVYDDGKVDIDAVLSELNSLGFFSTKKIIVIHQAQDLLKPAIEKLVNYFQNPNPSSFLVITATSVAANTIFYKKSEVAGVILDIPEEKAWEKEKSLKDWIENIFIEKGKSFDSQVSFQLLKQIGTSQALLFQEIEKLLCYVGDRKHISLQDIQDICISINVENVWQLGESIFRRDAKTALRISLNLLHDGTPLLMLLRQIRSQFQTDFQVCTIMVNGGTPVDVTKQFAYMKGQILDKHISFSTAYGLHRFKKGLILIDEAEASCKSASTDYAFLIERLIAKLTI